MYCKVQTSFCYTDIHNVFPYMLLLATQDRWVHNDKALVTVAQFTTTKFYAECGFLVLS